jgi:hypothetical protein
LVMYVIANAGAESEEKTKGKRSSENSDEMTWT